MKKIKIIAFSACLVVLLNLHAFSQTLSSAIGETINFLQDKSSPVNTVRGAYIEFSFFDTFNNLGVVSGRTNLSVISENQKLGTVTSARFFLKGTGNQWNNTNGSAANKSFSFTTPFLSGAASVLSIISSSGTGNFNLAANLPAVKTINSGLYGGTYPANEYIISGFIDPANPQKYVTIRIVQQFIPFG